MNCKFCLWCGGILELIEADKYLCKGCEKTHYVCPKASAGAFVFSGAGVDKKIYLAVRGRAPQKGKLHVFGGFLDSHESLEQAFLREFREETTIDSSKVRNLQYVGNGTTVYEWQGDNYPVNTVYFMTSIENPSDMKPSDDVEQIQAFTRDELKREDFAWPDVYDLAIKSWDLI
jgi:ADP-ribose pyrophosphatase YjhB (NUDIX family)